MHILSIIMGSSEILIKISTYLEKSENKRETGTDTERKKSEILEVFAVCGIGRCSLQGQRARALEGAMKNFLWRDAKMPLNWIAEFTPFVRAPRRGPANSWLA